MDNLISENTEYFSTIAKYGTTILIVGLVISLIMLISFWKIFQKAGKGGWEILIPIYGAYVFLEVCGQKGAWIFINLIPVIGQIIFIVITIKGLIELSRRFGKDTGFGILCLFFPIIGFPILAFSKATYQVETEEPTSSILDVNLEGVTEKQTFNYGYENQDTVAMNPVNSVETPVTESLNQNIQSNNQSSQEVEAPSVEQNDISKTVENEPEVQISNEASNVSEESTSSNEINEVDRFHTPSSLDDINKDENNQN